MHDLQLPRHACRCISLCFSWPGASQGQARASQDCTEGEHIPGPASSALRSFPNARGCSEQHTYTQMHKHYCFMTPQSSQEPYPHFRGEVTEAQKTLETSAKAAQSGTQALISRALARHLGTGSLCHGCLVCGICMGWKVSCHLAFEGLPASVQSVLMEASSSGPSGKCHCFLCLCAKRVRSCFCGFLSFF